MLRRRSALPLAVISLLLAVTGCSDGNGRSSPSTTSEAAEGIGSIPSTGSEGAAPPTADTDPFSVAAGLEELPSAVLGRGYVITAADLDAASQLARIERSPDEGGDDEDAFLTGWLMPVTGANRNPDGVPVAALLPDAVSEGVRADPEALIGELGFSLDQVSWFVEASSRPSLFTVMAGRFDRDRLQEALGAPDDGYWSLGGDDFSRSRDDMTPARPIGEALRLAERNGRLAISRSTPPIAGWVSASGDRTSALEPLVAAASALDAADVYSAMLVDGSSQVVGPTGDRGDSGGGEPVLLPYAILGVGLTVEGDRPVAVLVYQHAEDSVASQNAERLQAMFAEDEATIDGRSLSRWFDSSDVEVSARTVTLRATLAVDVPPAFIWSLVTRDDVLTASR